MLVTSQDRAFPSMTATSIVGSASSSHAPLCAAVLTLSPEGIPIYTDVGSGSGNGAGTGTGSLSACVGSVHSVSVSKASIEGKVMSAPAAVIVIDE